ncbi:symmetrical bis(5'-nucleosyl)-tetraphosphatase [Bordetella tumulicola]|uniref:symmetrical bis(5'-nucleosyl)-tetraphosphatase n=1 Tax=Bordetella tumulicola TaxID=1649133 RepID=UPI0039EF79AB
MTSQRDGVVGPPTAPSIWVIGDVHGCAASLNALLSRPEIADDPDSRFWFVGDLVNRGPASAATLRRIMALGERATVVLGNHDLRALAIAAGCLRPARRDTLDDLLTAADLDVLLNWLRRRPLMHSEAGYLLAHAGIYPQWDATLAMSLAREAQDVLRDSRWRDYIRTLCGSAGSTWHTKLQGERRLRFIVNAFTRMRLCTQTGALVPGAKAAPGCWPSGTVPWFDVPSRPTEHTPIVFGHWATLGLYVRTDVTCVDTGCVTGGVLTAFRLKDRKVVQVGRDTLAPAFEAPGATPHYCDWIQPRSRHAWPFQASGR